MLILRCCDLENVNPYFLQGVKGEDKETRLEGCERLSYGTLLFLRIRMKQNLHLFLLLISFVALVSASLLNELRKNLESTENRNKTDD